MSNVSQTIILLLRLAIRDPCPTVVVVAVVPAFALVLALLAAGAVPVAAGVAFGTLLCRL